MQPPLHPFPSTPCSCVVDLEGVVKRQWRIQRIQEVLVAKGGRYILVRPGACKIIRKELTLC